MEDRTNAINFLNEGAEAGVPTKVIANLLGVSQRTFEVDVFYWTVLAPDIVNPGREEQGSFSV
jgi:hypothetical protein